MVSDDRPGPLRVPVGRIFEWKLDRIEAHGSHLGHQRCEVVVREWRCPHPRVDADHSSHRATSGADDGSRWPSTSYPSRVDCTPPSGTSSPLTQTSALSTARRKLGSAPVAVEVPSGEAEPPTAVRALGGPEQRFRTARGGDDMGVRTRRPHVRSGADLIGRRRHEHGRRDDGIVEPDAEVPLVDGRERHHPPADRMVRRRLDATHRRWDCTSSCLRRTRRSSSRALDHLVRRAPRRRSAGSRARPLAGPERRVWPTRRCRAAGGRDRHRRRSPRRPPRRRCDREAAPRRSTST